MYMSRGERIETSAISGLAMTIDLGELSSRRSVPSFTVTRTGWPWVGIMSNARLLPDTTHRTSAAASAKTRRLIDKLLLHFTAAVDLDTALDVAARDDRAGWSNRQYAADIGIHGEGGA